MEKEHAKYSELTFQAIVESTPNAIVLVNKEGKIAYVNNQTEILFGYARSELIGQLVEILIPERYHKNHPGFRNMFLATPTVRAMGAGRELFALRKNKTEFPIEIGLNPVITVDGTLVLASIIDIAERKRLQKDFQVLVEGVQDYAIIMLDIDGNISSWNAGAERFKGYKANEIIGKNFSVFYPTDEIREHKPERELKIASETGRTEDEGWRIRKDGTRFWANIIITALREKEGGEIRGFLKVTRDLTEQKKMEERFRLVVEAAPNAMILINKEGVITLVNNQTEKLFGFERTELIGNKIEILIPERFRVHHPNHRNNFLDSPSVRAMGVGRDLFATKKDGSEVQVEIGLNPIETTEGQMVLASIIDITERKIQEAIIKNQVKLETKNKELEQFTYIASHDLLEPLRTVSNYIQILDEDYEAKLDQQGKNYLKTIDNASKRMQTLVRALLDYSRLGRTREKATADCKKIIQDAISDLQNLIQATKTKIEFSDDMPVIPCFEIELHQLFQNLLNNAIKFAKPDCAPVIKIESKKINDYWEFTITDNGIGIEEKHFERVFNIFQQLNPTDRHGGYGIGLANCKKIVELHNGRIWITSQFGVGSTFHFTILSL